jgi:hypothetical protein
MCVCIDWVVRSTAGLAVKNGISCKAKSGSSLIACAAPTIPPHPRLTTAVIAPSLPPSGSPASGVQSLIQPSTNRSWPAVSRTGVKKKGMAQLATRGQDGAEQQEPGQNSRREKTEVRWGGTNACVQVGGIVTDCTVSGRRCTVCWHVLVRVSSCTRTP